MESVPHTAGGPVHGGMEKSHRGGGGGGGGGGGCGELSERDLHYMLSMSWCCPSYGDSCTRQEWIHRRRVSCCDFKAPTLRRSLTKTTSTQSSSALNAMLRCASPPLPLPATVAHHVSQKHPGGSRRLAVRDQKSKQQPPAAPAAPCSPTRRHAFKTLHRQHPSTPRHCRCRLTHASLLP